MVRPSNMVIFNSPKNHIFRSVLGKTKLLITSITLYITEFTDNNTLKTIFKQTTLTMFDHETWSGGLSTFVKVGKAVTLVPCIKSHFFIL